MLHLKEIKAQKSIFLAVLDVFWLQHSTEVTSAVVTILSAASSNSV